MQSDLKPAQKFTKHIEIQGVHQRPGTGQIDCPWAWICPTVLNPGLSTQLYSLKTFHPYAWELSPDALLGLLWILMNPWKHKSRIQRKWLQEQPVQHTRISENQKLNNALNIKITKDSERSFQSASLMNLKHFKFSFFKNSVHWTIKIIINNTPFDAQNAGNCIFELLNF